MRGGSGATSGALRVATTRWRRRGRGKVARRSRRRRDNRGDATTSWQTRGNGRGGVQEANRRGGVSGQEAAERREDKRRRRHDVRLRDNQPEAPAEPPPPPPPPSSPAGMASLSRTLATVAAATSLASSASSASAKSARPPSSSSTPSHRRRRRPNWTCGVPFWRRQRPLRSSCSSSNRCGGWCDEKLTSVICCVLSGVWNSLLAKTKVENLFDSISTTCKYIFT